jgi:cytoskeletal protein RodZ
MIRVLGVLSGLVMAALVLSLTGWITGQRLINQLLTAPPASGPGQPAEQPRGGFPGGQLLPSVSDRPVTKTPKESTASPSPARPANEPASVEGPASANSVQPAPKPSVTSQQPLSGEAATPNTTPTPSRGQYRAELTRAPVSRGWGDSYAVRLSNSAGQPVKLSGVLLVAHMADGSVENIAMGALPEPGMYRGTVPTARSTPVDLRVRVRTGDKFIQIPLTRQ